MVIDDRSTPGGDATPAAVRPHDEYHLVHDPDTHVGELRAVLPDGGSDGGQDASSELRQWAAGQDAVRRALGRKF